MRGAECGRRRASRSKRRTSASRARWLSPSMLLRMSLIAAGRASKRCCAAIFHPSPPADPLDQLIAADLTRVLQLQVEAVDDAGDHVSQDRAQVADDGRIHGGVEGPAGQAVPVATADMAKYPPRTMDAASSDATRIFPGCSERGAGTAISHTHSPGTRNDPPAVGGDPCQNSRTAIPSAPTTWNTRPRNRAGASTTGCRDAPPQRRRAP